MNYHYDNGEYYLEIVSHDSQQITIRINDELQYIVSARQSMRDAAIEAIEEYINEAEDADVPESWECADQGYNEKVDSHKWKGE